MPVRITCPHCHRDLRLPEHLYEGPCQCPDCDGAFAIRWHPRPAADRPDVPTPPAGPAHEARKPCRFCGELILPTAVKCPFCRAWLQERHDQRT